MQAIEFFSGIGGLHYACKRAGSIEVIAAFDVNTIANSVYAHNFKINPSTKSIDSLTSDMIDALAASVWLLSPPCQPFTHGGKRLDDQDMRSKGLLNLIQLLQQVRSKPQFVFLENVVNFEVSVCRRLLVSTLDSLGYTIKEYILTPLQLGIPNDRKRYYLTARLDHSPKKGEYLLLSEIIRNINHKNTTPQLSLSPYLESRTEFHEYKVPDNFIIKRTNFRFGIYNMINQLDVVKPSDIQCSVFTKAYGSHHVFGSGSMIQTHAFDQDLDYSDSDSLLNAQLRFFTPSEIARLHFFPIDSLKSEGSETKEFEFPNGLTLRQKWQLLGNSLNVLVVSELIKKDFLL
jgi:tRNA (cytosine38-C5)-methyltransferase